MEQSPPAPDGTVYVTPRVETPTVIVSKDNGFTWFAETMGEDSGTPYPRKNSEVATDTQSNAYHIWTGADEGVYMSRSTDSGETWEQDSIRISPVEIISSVFPQVDAGDPGRIAITYPGSENSSQIGQPNLDGEPWDGTCPLCKLQRDIPPLRDLQLERSGCQSSVSDT